MNCVSPTRPSRCSNPQNHYLGRFHESRCSLPDFQPHLFGRIGGNNCRDMLLADRHPNLCQQAAILHFQHASDQLIAAAYFAEIATPCFDASAFQFFRNHAVDLALRNAMVPARRLHGLELPVIDPLLQGRIADAQYVRRFPRRKQPLQSAPPTAMQNISDGVAIAIRLNTLWKNRNGFHASLWRSRLRCLNYGLEVPDIALVPIRAASSMKSDTASLSRDLA